MSMKFGDELTDYVIADPSVLVKPFTTIGFTGFGFEKDKLGNFKYPLKRKPHVYKVIIKANVEIGAHCCIDRGSWRHSIIGKGTKIDNMVHTGHNTQIGEHCIIAVGVTIGGSCTIGNKCKIWMNASIKDNLTIADKVEIGQAAVVVKDILEKGTTWVGNPAKKLEERNY